MTNKESEERLYDYLELNRGRYLCDEHGAFCDSSDNYLSRCPLCPNSGRTDWKINKVDRLLQVVKGLQNRSKRNVALLATLIGGIGVLRLGSELSGNLTSGSFSDCAIIFVYLAVVLLIISLAMYGASMAHIKTTENKMTAEKSLRDWDQFLASKLSKMECMHNCGGLFFTVGAIFLAIAVFAQMISGIGLIEAQPTQPA